MLRCPVCRAPLARQANSYRCDRGHSFDIARSGYVNLLRGGSHRVRGDDAAMLRSRRAFMEAGHYAPLLRDLIRRLGGSPVSAILDVGCGEGYFTGEIARALPGVSVWGMDISRLAVDMAASRRPEAGFAVAAARMLPVADCEVDVVLSIFGPQPFHEFRRVLNPEGRLVVVGPGSEHLVEIRTALYREVRPPGRQRDSGVGLGWRLADRKELLYVLHLEASGSEHLLAMTPYSWAGGPHSRLGALEVRSVTVHFVVREMVPPHE